MAKEFKPLSAVEGIEKMIQEQEANPSKNIMDTPPRKLSRPKIKFADEVTDPEHLEASNKTFYLTQYSQRIIAEYAQKYKMTESKFLNKLIREVFEDE